MDGSGRSSVGALLGIILSMGLALATTSMARAAPPPLEAYGRLPGWELAAISPSGKRIALLGTVGGKRQVTVMEHGNRIFAKAIGDEKMRRLSWAGDDHLLLLSSDTVPLEFGYTMPMAELSAIQVVSLDGRPSWSLFASNPSMNAAVYDYYGAIERSGHWYGYFAGIANEHPMVGLRQPQQVNPSLFQVDLDNHRVRMIARKIEAQFGARDWVIDADGQIAATLDFFANSGEWSIRTADRRTIATGNAPLGGVELIALSSDGQGVVYHVEDAGDESEHFWIQPLAGGAATELAPGELITSVNVDDRSRRMIGYTRAGDLRELHMLDPHQDAIVAAARKRFPGVAFRLVDASSDFGTLLVETSGSGDPKTLWTIDTATGHAERLEIAYPIAADQVGPVRMFAFATRDGLNMAGVLTLPPDRPARDLPLVMMPHGGPADRDYPVFDWWAQAFASRGYAVFQPNFRGSDELGAAFRFAGRAEWGRKMQSDLTDGLAALAASGIVDPRRSCIVGGSYGGYAALAGVTLQQNIYRCAVSVAGIADVSRMAIDDRSAAGGNPAIGRWLRTEVGDDDDLKAISPINFVDRITVPVLLIHGVDDTIVHYEQSSAMAAALRRAGKPVELVTLKGEDHWLSKSETRLTMLKASVEFVEKHNPPDPTPAH
jgi:dienelactone hydrolase